MVVTERRMTADEFLALPPEPNTQLIDGEIVVNDPTGFAVDVADLFDR